MRTDERTTTAKTKEKKLKVNKETIKDLDARKAEQVKGGKPLLPETSGGPSCYACK